jgi:hypothetical protein
MAALNDAMKWYQLGQPGLSTVPRLKYHFQVKFYSAHYQTELGDLSKNLYQTIRSVDMPKFTVDTEILNAWNIRQPVHTRVTFEPITIHFNDTQDNSFQNFIKAYMNIISGNFAEAPSTVRTYFDTFGIQMLDTGQDCLLDKIEIIKFYGANQDKTQLENTATTTLWRPKIVEVSNDTMDYSISEAMTWQITLRYESITYEPTDAKTPQPAGQATTTSPAQQPASPDKVDWLGQSNPLGGDASNPMSFAANSNFGA